MVVAESETTNETPGELIHAGDKLRAGDLSRRGNEWMPVEPAAIGMVVRPSFVGYFRRPTLAERLIEAEAATERLRRECAESATKIADLEARLAERVTCPGTQAVEELIRMREERARMLDSVVALDAETAVDNVRDTLSEAIDSADGAKTAEDMAKEAVRQIDGHNEWTLEVIEALPVPLGEDGTPRMDDSRTVPQVIRDLVAESHTLRAQLVEHERELDILHASNRVLTAIRDEGATETQRWRDRALAAEARLDAGVADATEGLLQAENIAKAYEAEAESLRAKLAETERRAPVTVDPAQDRPPFAPCADCTAPSIHPVCHPCLVARLAKAEEQAQARASELRDVCGALADAGRLVMKGESVAAAVKDLGERARRAEAETALSRRESATAVEGATRHLVEAQRAATERERSRCAQIAARHGENAIVQEIANPPRLGVEVAGLAAREAQAPSGEPAPVEASEPEVIRWFRVYVSGGPGHEDEIKGLAPEVLRLYDAARAERDALTDRLAAVLVQRDQAVAEAAAFAAEALDLRAQLAAEMETNTTTRGRLTVAEVDREDLREKHARQRETIRGVIESLNEHDHVARPDIVTLGDAVRDVLAQKDAEIARLKAALDGTLVDAEPGAHDAELVAWHERHEKHASILERMRAAGAL